MARCCCVCTDNERVLCTIMDQFNKYLLFPPSTVWCPTWFPDILGNSSYPIFTKFGMQVYWVNSLYGIAFGDDSSIANSVIATLLLLSSSLVSRHFKECY